MANPQKENGHIDFANEIAEHLARFRISGEEYQILWVIWRKTYGWHKKEDCISLTQFYLATGMKKPSIIRAINKLLEKNIISRKANATAFLYRFNKDFDTWFSLAKKLIISNIANSVSKRANESLAKELPTKEIKETIQKKEPAISFLLVKTLLEEMNLTRPDGDYQMDNIFPAKTLAKIIKEVLEKDGETNITNDRILEAFKILLRKMENFHRKNATNIKYIKNNFNKIYNSI